MNFVRALYRAFLLSVCTFIIIGSYSICHLIFINNPKKRLACKNAFISRWAKVSAKIIGLQMTITGRTPEPPFLLVSNHLSYVDILPFWGLLQTTFIAKTEINSWPFIGRMARLMGILFVDRNKRSDVTRVNKVIEQNRSEYQGIILFPEGTSTKGDAVLTFKSSLLQYPASHFFPVHYASISYHIPDQNSKAASEYVCWWGDMDFAGHFWKLLKIKQVFAHVHFGEQPVIEEDRKILANKLHQKVKEHFKPVV